MKPTVLVTGDVVLDCHLYGGVKTAATSFSEPGTTYEQYLSGAALTQRLLQAGTDAAEAQWTNAGLELAKKNAALAAKGLAPVPDERGPSPAFGVHLGIQTAGLADSLPGHLRSFGVWTDKLAKKGSNERVWRVDRHFGYGPTDPVTAQVFQRKPLTLDREPALTLIDDGGILFRQGRSDAAWPAFNPESKTHYVLKMSAPLCRGDLWAALEPVKDRLIVIVSAGDLRREDTKITHRLSWEQCAESTLRALDDDPIGGELLSAAHLIVNFRSAGALWIRRTGTEDRSVRLIFDHLQLEDDFARDFEGTAYGFQTCVAVSVAHHLMVSEARSGASAPGSSVPSPFSGDAALAGALEFGIVAGLATHRKLLELGHGPVKQLDPAKPELPGFPIAALGKVVASQPGGFVSAEVPADVLTRVCPWTILAHAELSRPSPTALTGVAELTARYGFDALSHVPGLRLGRLFTVDRAEIESLRALDTLIRDYENTKVQKKPLCIGVFGQPGSGKSFGVKALAEAILTDKVPFLEFNLSQFKSPEELIGAFHRVRDAVLKGLTPVAFWDEFDAQHYKWLQYLLAPMQDGAFQEGQVTHPIGKCIFVFAGGTSPSIEEFGVLPPSEMTGAERAALSVQAHADRVQQEADFKEFRLLKGPDFISRLHGFLNVLGPNERIGALCPDITWPIRRALILRSLLDLRDAEELNIDLGLLHALLSVPKYHHGARSFEKIVVALVQGRDNGRLHRAALPPDPALDRETNAVKFEDLMEQWNAFKNHPEIESLAAAVHASFLEGAEKAALTAAMNQQPQVAWEIHPAVATVYEQLNADLKAANRAAARRVPEHLALINFVLVRRGPNDNGSWRQPLVDAIEQHIERLARAEHLGWAAERRANGWSYNPIRNNDLKHHPLLIEWSKLSPANQDKDRHSARSIPDWLQVAGFKAVRAGTSGTAPRA